jgi:hypothetical protein
LDYQPQEGQQALSHDPGEGVSTTRTIPSLEPLSGNFDGCEVEGLYCPTGSHLATHGILDCWMFCASIGGYKADRHQKMLELQRDLPEEKRYTEYAVIRVWPFLRKLVDKVVEKKQHKIDRVRLDPVTYDGPDKVVPAREFARQLNPEIHARSLRDSQFRKPEWLTHEEEMRAVFFASYAQRRLGLSWFEVEDTTFADLIVESGSYAAD